MNDNHQDGSTAVSHLDVLIVGAGFGGLAILRTLRDAGHRVRVVETGDGVGGTWYWNRYPGARVDIESMEYSYPFADLQMEWSWPEKFSAQEDVLRYLNWAADRLDLRGHIDLEREVTSAVFDQEAASWHVTTQDRGGRSQHYSAKYVVLATGFLSVPNLPVIPGLQDFAGVVAHTARWPEDGIDFEGKRVGVIGTAASGVQVIQTVAPVAERLTVFQRTANWCFPLRNVAMSEDYESWVKANYDEIRRLEYESRGPGSVLVGNEIIPPSDVSALEVSDDERSATFAFRWEAGGPSLGRAFTDLSRDENANNYLRQFWTARIAELVHDPETARKLTPLHPPLTRRPPGATGYFETYNRDNVELVDIGTAPLDHVNASGVRLASGAEFELDVLILATGFDAGGGAALQIELVGRDGLTIQEHWSDGVRTAFGMLVDKFPNLFLVNGPQSPSTHFSPPLLAVYQGEVIARVIDHVNELGETASIEATSEAAEEWTVEVRDLYEQTMIPQTDSWWMGANIPGKPRRPVSYMGGFAEYRRLVDASLNDLSTYEVRKSSVEIVRQHAR